MPRISDNIQAQLFPALEQMQRVVPEYVAFALTKLVQVMQAWAAGGTFAEISKSKFCELKIPVPPLEVQKEIVAGIENHQAKIERLKDEITEEQKKIQTTIAARVWDGET